MQLRMGVEHGPDAPGPGAVDLHRQHAADADHQYRVGRNRQRGPRHGGATAAALGAKRMVIGLAGELAGLPESPSTPCSSGWAVSHTSVGASGAIELVAR